MANEFQIRLKGFVGDYQFDANYVDYVLNKYKDQQVNVLIDSLGGNIAAALSISAAFGLHGNVHVHYVGMNASAATVASLGAAHVSIDASAMYLVHKCSQMILKWDLCNADQLQELIDECEKTKKDLDKIDLNIASGYAARCKKDKECLLELMKEGGWLTADEALAWGFVDEITNFEQDEEPKLDEKVVGYMAANGIPVPSVPFSDGCEQQSLLHKFKEYLRGLYSNQMLNQTLQAMKKTYVNVCRILSCPEGFDSEDGKIVMSEEQVQVIEDAMANDGEKLAALEANVAQRDKEIADLKAQVMAKEAEIANMGKQAAEDTTQVNNNAAHAAPIEGFAQEMASAREMLNQLKK